ncbi:MAG TPA: hypothetical protein PLG02_08700 [Methylotenera sp.]|nr:hypothetical protein [Methylotenera sp.]
MKKKMIGLDYTGLCVLLAQMGIPCWLKLAKKKHTNHAFSHSTFFDALEAFIYMARRAYFFSREKMPLKLR